MSSELARTDRCRPASESDLRFGLVCAQAFDFARNDQVFILAERDAVFGGELLRAFGDEINVRAFAQNLAGGAHRIAQVLDASHAPGAKRGAVHDQGIELHFAVAVEEAAASGIESLVVFHDDDGFFDSVERRAAALEHAPSRSQRVVDTVDVGVDHVIGHGPGAAMNDQDGIMSARVSPELVKRLDRIAGRVEARGIRSRAQRMKGTRLSFLWCLFIIVLTHGVAGISVLPSLA